MHLPTVVEFGRGKRYFDHKYVDLFSFILIDRDRTYLVSKEYATTQKK